jgi:hypothetical protein
MRIYAFVSDSAINSIDTGKRIRAESQSGLVEDCAGIVRWRDRQNHAFAP